MVNDDIKLAVQAVLPDAQVEVEMDGNHAHLKVISTAFEGLTPVKKQQLVYGALQDAIASGEIHAVHMNTYTPQQWAQQSQ